MKKTKKMLLSLMLFLLGGFISAKNVQADAIDIDHQIDIMEYEFWYYIALFGIIFAVIALSIFILKMLYSSNNEEKK